MHIYKSMTYRTDAKTNKLLYLVIFLDVLLKYFTLMPNLKLCNLIISYHGLKNMQLKTIQIVYWGWHKNRKIK